MGVMNVDPTRLGAQVVSGIGFLGAGTIIKEGFSVKGLTTAASLWAVSCVGLTCVIATLLIYFALQFIKRAVMKHSETRVICLMVSSADVAAKEAEALFGKLSLVIVSSEISVADEGHLELKYAVIVKKSEELFDYAINKLKMTDGIMSVHVE